MLDEPFIGLDSATARGIATQLSQMRERTGTSFLLISHQEEYARLLKPVRVIQVRCAVPCAPLGACLQVHLVVVSLPLPRCLDFSPTRSPDQPQAGGQRRASQPRVAGVAIPVQPARALLHTRTHSRFLQPHAHHDLRPHLDSAGSAHQAQGGGLLRLQPAPDFHGPLGRRPGHQHADGGRAGQDRREAASGGCASSDAPGWEKERVPAVAKPSAARSSVSVDYEPGAQAPKGPRGEGQHAAGVLAAHCEKGTGEWGSAQAPAATAANQVSLWPPHPRAWPLRCKLVPGVGAGHD